MPAKRKRGPALLPLPPAAGLPVPLPPPKKQSVAEQIDRYEEKDDGSLIFDIIANITDDEKTTYGFRHLAPSTQARQDRHLVEYRKYVKLRKRLDPNLDDDATDVHAFPDNQAELLRLLREFLIFIFTHAKGRTRNSGYVERITYRSLGHFRGSLLFWVPRKLVERNIEPPKQAVLFNSMTEQMRYVQAKYGNPNRGRKLAGLGLVELRQLVEHAMTTSRSVELAEQFAAICCLARQTAVRPGSIGWNKGKRQNYLRWKDCQFINNGNGNFTVIISFKHLKTNKDDPQAGTWRTLDCYLDSPNEENLIFSIPHRLLMMALRHGKIADMNSIDDLVNSNLARFNIKPENMDDPIFYAGLPGGRGIDTSPDENGLPRALSAQQITAWISAQGRALGYTDPITLYSFRRRAATDLVERVGYAMTREIMGHSPQSSTLERYYVNIRSRLDMTGAALDQSIGPSGIKPGISSAIAPVALGQLPDAVLNEIRNVAVNQLADEMMDADPNFPEDADEAGLKSYRRRVRAFAFNVLIERAAAEQAQTATIQDKAARQQQWLQDAVNFQTTVYTRAQALLQQQNAVLDIQRLERDHNIDLSESLDEGSQDTLDHPAEADIEDVMGAGSDSHTEVRVTGEEFARIAQRPDSIPYNRLVVAFMEILEQNLYTKVKVPWKHRPTVQKLCPLCLDDATVTSNTDLKRVWREEQDLANHMTTGTFHSPYGVWHRAQKLAMAEYKKKNPTTKQPAVCPYADPEHAFSDLSHLVRHIETVISKKGGKTAEDQAEYERIADDGWEDVLTWKGVPSVSSQRDNIKRTRRNLTEAGVERAITFLPHCSAQADPAHANVMIGDVEGAGLNKLPEHLASFITLGASPQAPLPSATAQPFLRNGTEEPFFKAVPARFAHYIQRGQPPAE